MTPTLIEPGYISSQEIQAAKGHYEAGCMVRTHTYKTRPLEDGGQGGRDCMAEIVSKHEHFAVVRLRGGMPDSVLWTDLALQLRKKEAGKGMAEWS